jgi:hypothetical protein
MGEALMGGSQESEVRSQNENPKIVARCDPRESRSPQRIWIPACAGMTTLCDFRISIFGFRFFSSSQHSDF